MAEPIKGKLVTIKNLETGEVTDLSGAWVDFDFSEAAKPKPDWERMAGEYSRELAKAKERLRVIDRRIDRVDLAKRLFLKRMGQAYATIPERTLEDLWHDQDASCQNAWLVVADEAIRLTLATDL